MRTSKRILAVVGAIIGVILVNMLLTFAIVPYGSKSEVMWHDFRQSNNIDMVYLGTSQLERSVNPQVIDDAIGSNSFNMSTPAQTMDDSLLGIEEAFEHHDIKTVVLGVEYAELVQRAKSRAGVFAYEKIKGESFGDAVHDIAAASGLGGGGFDPSILTAIAMPWMNQHVGSLPAIFENIRMRLDGTSLYKASEVNDPGWKYVGKGFGSEDKYYDFNTGLANTYAYKYHLQDATKFNDERLSVLDKICKLCKDHGAQLVVVVPALSDDNMVNFGKHYEELSNMLRSFLEERGAKFYDMNLSTEALFDNENSFWSDDQHMNLKGAQAFSEALAKVLGAERTGAPTDGMFCSYEDRVAQVKGMTSAMFSLVECDDTAIRFEAAGVAGPGLQPEYRFSVRKLGDEDFTVIQDYSPSHQCSYTPEGGHNPYEIRLEARVKDATDPEIEQTRLVLF